jgi:phosphotransferase system HPr (HPr) family protein
MFAQKVTVPNRTGLHARPASDFTRLAAGFKSRVEVGRPGEDKINAKSIVMVLSLSMGQGTEIEISARGDDEREAVESLVKYVSELKE